tara:strand:- start:1553 stop:5620 length:4068 start_codon:yes stop_codon:yes gene_type:complete
MSNQLQVSGEAKIRAIQGPVVANSGVITALDGDATQYVRGDGTLADFPTSTGGGSSVSYYLNSSVSQGTIGGVAYRQLSKVPISGAGTDISTSANGYIASYITDANDPSLLEVPAGNFNCEFYFSVNSDAHNPYVYAEIYKYDGTTFTLLGSNVAIPEYLSNGTTLSPYYFAVAVASSVLSITDRIAIRIYVNVDTRTVTLHTENNHLCQVVTTFSKGLTTLNSLTRQVQFFATGTSGTDFAISSATATHTFNLPVASASNTGKLSSTDWSTFNNKVGGSGSDGRVAFWTGANTLSSDANLYYDYSTDRLGIGTNTPNASLGILNASSTGIQVRTSDSANQYQANIYYDSSFGMVYGYNRLGSGTASNLTVYNNIGGFLSIPESANNNIGFNTINPQGSSATTVYDFTSLSTSVEIRLHNPTTGYTATDGSFIKVTPTALSINNAETSQDIYINNGGNNAFRINGTNKVGIGDFSSTTPTEQLSVAGSIQQTGITSTMVKVDSAGKFVAATGGTDYEYPLTFSSPLVRTTNTISIPAATTSVSGYLTSTDWNTFNNKGSGTVTSVSGTAPVISSGGATPNISMAAATTSVSGYLTSTDWTTFNNKYTLPSLTQGSILFYDGSNIAQNNSKLYWDNSNMRLGIGVQSQAQYVTYIQANAATNGNAWVAIDNPNATGSTALRLILNGGTTSGFQYVQSTNMTQVYANAGDIQLINGSSLGLTIANTTGAGTFSASATATSFVKVGGTSSQFLKADGSVDSSTYGTGTVTSVATSAPLTGGTITTSGTIGITQATTSTNGYLSSTDWNTFNNKTTLPSLTSGSVLFSNGSTIAQDNANFFWDDVNNRLGIGTSAPASILHILGASATLIIDGNSSGTQTNAFLRLRTGGFNVGNFAYNLATDNIQISNVSGGSGGGVQIFGTSGSTTGITIAPAGNVGVNIPSGSPLSPLQVVGTGTVFRYGEASGTTGKQILFGVDATTGRGEIQAVWQGTSATPLALNPSSGSVLVGITTDNGNKLQVNGTGYFASDVAIGISSVSSVWSRTLQVYNSSSSAVSIRTSVADWHIGSNNSGSLFHYNNTNGTHGLTITNTGNVGIGTTTPSGLLHVEKNQNASNIQYFINSSTGGSAYTHLQIGKTAAGDNTTYGLVQYYNPNDSFNILAAAGAIGGLNITHNGAYPITFATSGTERMRIFSNGNVGIGITTDTTFKFTVQGEVFSKGDGAALFVEARDLSVKYAWYAGSNTALNFYSTSGGVVGNFNRITGIYTPTSDINKKRDFEESKLGLKEILQLKPTLYRMKIDEDEADKHLGFIAQEVKEFIPQAYSDNDGMIGLDYNPIVATLVKAVQELEARIKQLENK